MCGCELGTACMQPGAFSLCGLAVVILNRVSKIIDEGLQLYCFTAAVLAQSSWWCTVGAGCVVGIWDCRSRLLAVEVGHCCMGHLSSAPTAGVFVRGRCVCLLSLVRTVLHM